jgi:hypothetical protein
MTVSQKQEDLVCGLFQALVNDGFTAYRCGPQNDPTALIAFYEWDDHIDVITVPQAGSAAAARLAKQDWPDQPQVLEPPPTAVWTWVGDPEPAIWALLRLKHPDHPDAPAEQVPTPAELRVPRELQRPIITRVPPPVRPESAPNGSGRRETRKTYRRSFSATCSNRSIPPQPSVQPRTSLTRPHSNSPTIRP